MKQKLIDIRNLGVAFYTEHGILRAVQNVSFHIQPGEILSLVGESGCGKTVTALSLLRLVSSPGKISSGEIVFAGKDLLKISEKEMQSIRGNKISMIFQEPMTSLNPVMTIGDQVAEGLIVHKKMKKTQALKEAVHLLEAVRIADPHRRVKDYPHHLSGGMRQRVMIAMALACGPSLLIADEPTTALDVTIQAQILELLDQLRKEFGLSILLITHALGVVAEVADRVIVMYSGRIVEEAPVKELFANASHPYTVGLLESIPRISLEGARPARLKTIEGGVPNLLDLPPGCWYYDRCKDRMEICATAFPEIIWITPDHYVACYKYESA